MFSNRNMRCTNRIKFWSVDTQQNDSAFTESGFCCILIKNVIYGNFALKRISREDVYYMNGDIARILSLIHI